MRLTNIVRCPDCDGKCEVIEYSGGMYVKCMNIKCGYRQNHGMRR